MISYGICLSIRLTSLSMILSKFIRGAANGIISLLLQEASPKRSCWDLCERMFCLCFPPRVFILSSLTFRSLIHFECIFCIWYMFYFHSFQCSSPVFLAPLTEETVFSSIVYSCLFCHRLIGRKCVGLFLDFLSCFTDLCVCFSVSTLLLGFLQLCSSV